MANGALQSSSTRADGTGATPSVTVLILTLNEAVHLRRCLLRVAPVARRVVVIDSFSDDQTAEIATELGAEIHRRAFRNQADQLQWALDNLYIDTDWVLRLDADEYLEPAAIEEILERTATLPGDITGIDFKLKVIFWGRWIRHGGYYATVLTRMWRTGVGSCDQRWMDERIVLSRGRSLRFARGDLVDHSLKDIGWWTDKHNRYATRQMLDFINREQRLFAIDSRVDEKGHGQARWKRFLRNRIYARTPLYVRSVLYFLQRYFLRLGFLDGRQGFVFHVLHGLWYFVLIDAKIDEARRLIRTQGVEAFRKDLKARHGIEV